MTLDKAAASELSIGFVFGMGALGFCLALGHCGAAQHAMSATRYAACVQATKSVQECGKP